MPTLPAPLLHSAFRISKDFSQMGRILHRASDIFPSKIEVGTILLHELFPQHVMIQVKTRWVLGKLTRKFVYQANLREDTFGSDYIEQC